MSLDHSEQALIQKVKNLAFSINMATEEIKHYLKNADRPTTHYIWRTRGDGKVRSRHAKFNGKVFSWNNPPESGYHPGEDYGCRCWAEPFDPEDNESRKEFSSHVVSGAASDSTSPWNTLDYTRHYRHGNGANVTLHETGQLQNVIDYASSYNQPKGGTIFERFARDIFTEARQKGAGSFYLSFNANYDMRRIATSFRTVLVYGTANINITDRGKFLIVNADIEYSFYDRYTDPTDWRNHFDDEDDEINDDYGTPYDITDTWIGTLTAMIKKEGSQSKYPDK